MDVRHRAHLAVQLAQYVKGDQINDYSYERGDAGKAINLRGANQSVAHSQGKAIVSPQAPVDTDPYRPPVGYAPSDNSPLVVK